MDIRSHRDDWPRKPWNRPGPLVLSDDPTDHGLSAAERACIEKAYAIRRREIRAALEPAPRGGSRSREFDVPQPTNVREWMLWIFVLPWFYVALLLMKVVLGPLEYWSDRREKARRQASLRQELSELERPPLLQSIGDKSLWALWQVYGFERDRFAESASVELANAWLDRLYGAGTRKALDLDARLDAVSKRRERSRAESPQITCVLWVPRLEQVLKELSKELPPYDWAEVDRGPRGRVH